MDYTHTPKWWRSSKPNSPSQWPGDGMSSMTAGGLMLDHDCWVVGLIASCSWRHVVVVLILMGLWRSFLNRGYVLCEKLTKQRDYFATALWKILRLKSCLCSIFLSCPLNYVSHHLCCSYSHHPLQIIIIIFNYPGWCWDPTLCSGEYYAAAWVLDYQKHLEIEEGIFHPRVGLCFCF